MSQIIQNPIAKPSRHPSKQQPLALRGFGVPQVFANTTTPVHPQNSHDNSRDDAYRPHWKADHARLGDTRHGACATGMSRNRPPPPQLTFRPVSTVCASPANRRVYAKINGVLGQVYPGNTNRSADVVCIVFIFVYAVGYSMGFGPAAWVYGAEVRPLSAPPFLSLPSS